jgi:hypothetical protein
MSAADTSATDGFLGRVGSAWSRFWFTPADPTPLCLMRIVAGLVTLYVHIAYTFDLQALMGRAGWYDVAQADRERREWPNFVTPSRWTPPADSQVELADRRFRMPLFPEQRAAVRQFLENLLRAPQADQERVLRLLNSLPDGGGRAETLRYLKDLERDSPTFAVLDELLDRMVHADRTNENTQKVLPEYLLSLKEADRQTFRADAHAFFRVLPSENRPRSNVFTLLISQSWLDWALLRSFIEELQKKPKDEAERSWALAYAEKWSCSPYEPEIIARGHVYYSPFYHVADPAGVAVLHAVHLAVIVLFTLGVCTRVTSVLTWLAALAYIQRDPLALFGQDTMMNLCLFYLMLAPCGATWSVDWLVARYRSGKRALREGRRLEPVPPQPLVSANFVIRLIQVHYCMMYLSAGLSKLKGESWWSGTAVFYTMTNPEFSPLHLSPYRELLAWLCQNEHRWVWEGYMTVTAIFTLFLEIGLPFLVWTRLRPVMVAGAILLHTGIALNMGLIVFSLFMFTLMLGAWMPPGAVRRVFARPPAKLPKIQVSFDGRSPKQLRAAAAVRALDVWGQAELADRAGAKAGRTAAPDGEPVRVTAGGTTKAGWSAARLVAKSLGITQPFAWLLGLPVVAQIGEALHPGAAAADAAKAGAAKEAVATRR